MLTSSCGALPGWLVRRAWPLALVVCLVGLFAAPTAHADPSRNDGLAWQLVWRDDFNGPAGAPVDSASWIHDLGHCYPGCAYPNWGSGDVPEMTDSTANSSLDGRGHLLITPLRDPADPTRWTSARLETARSDFGAPADGAMRVEIRMALPQVSGEAAKGYRSALWMLGAPVRPSYTDPSGSGDLDVVEHVNDKPEVVGAVHCQPPGHDPCHDIPDDIGLSGTTTCPPGDCRSGMHTYAVEVHRESTPQRIDWFVDGSVYHTVRADQPDMDAATWSLLVDRTFFLILSNSLGGGWPGAPTAQTSSGVPLVVDWVAVWIGRPRPEQSQPPEQSQRHEQDQWHEQNQRPDTSPRRPAQERPHGQPPRTGDHHDTEVSGPGHSGGKGGDSGTGGSCGGWRPV